MSIQRWNMRAVISTVDIEKSASGMYVKYEDYAEELATLKSQRDELLAAANRSAFRECQLVEAFKAYIDKYGPGYSSTDSLAYDNATGVLAAIANAEKGKPEC